MMSLKDVKSVKDLQGFHGWVKWFASVQAFWGACYVVLALTHGLVLAVIYGTFALACFAQFYFLSKEDVRGVYIARILSAMLLLTGAWGAIIWLVYFFVSRRVKLTYFPERYADVLEAAQAQA